MSELPRLLFCCFDVVPAPSATSRRLTEYLDTLSDRYQVVALTVKTPDHSHIERYRGARLLRVPVGSGDLRSRMEAFDRAVRRQLESEEYLVVHFFDPVSGYPLCERRSDFGYKLVYDACRFPSTDLPSLSPQEGSNKRVLARSRRQELFCLLNADAIVVGSEAAKAHAVALGVPGERVRVLRAPVDLGPFVPEVMGTPEGSPARLIHLSSHGRHQDLPVLFEALGRTTSQARLALVGPSSPELTAPLKARAAELGLNDRVEFQEPVAHADLHKVLAAADIGVVTLADEPRNRTTTALARVSEYLAAGRPIIAADLPLARELIPAEAARFYPPGDVAALALAIDALASDPGLRKTLGAAARAAAGLVDAKRIRGQLIEIYERIAPAAAAAAPASEDVAPDATLLGGKPVDEGEVTQASVPLTSAPPDVGTNKVKTDPAVIAPGSDSDVGTDRAQARERPAVMGVLLREPPPESTDPALAPSQQPPVVMGSPVPPTPEPTEPLRPPPPVPSPPPVSTVSPVPFPTIPELKGSTPSAPPPPPANLPSGDEPLDFAALLKPSAPPARPAAAVPDKKVPVPALPVPTSYSLPGKEALVGAKPAVGGSSTSGVRAVPAVSPPKSSPSAVTAPTATVPSSSPSAAAAPPASVPASSPSGTSPPPLPKSRGSGVQPALAEKSATNGTRATGAQPAFEPSKPEPAIKSEPPAAEPAPKIEPKPEPGKSELKPEPGRPPPKPERRSSGSKVGRTPVTTPAKGKLAAEATPTTPSGARLSDGLPPLSRLVPNPDPTGARAILTREGDDADVPHEDEVELVNDESFDSLSDEEPDHEIDAQELHALETSAAPPDSRLDPWFAQLVHGYCPPESQLFTRHVPPTTMPGRDT